MPSKYEKTIHKILSRITDSMASIDFDDTKEAVSEAMEVGIPAKEVIDSLSTGMHVIGDKFESGEYFISELIMAGEIFREAYEIVMPYMKKGEVESSGKVVIGTVEGDLHDIGKNIVISLMRIEGFEVVDLGINTPIKEFVDAVRVEKPDLLGLSALLRATVPVMGEVIKALEKENLRNNVKIIVGGLPLNEDYARELGGDYYAKDAWIGVKLIKKVVGAK